MLMYSRKVKSFVTAVNKRIKALRTVAEIGKSNTKLCKWKYLPKLLDSNNPTSGSLP